MKSFETLTFLDEFGRYWSRERDDDTRTRDSDHEQISVF